MSLLEKVEKYESANWKVWDERMIQGCEVSPGIFCLKTQTSLNISCKNATEYLLNPLKFKKWVLGCEDSDEKYGVEPYGKIAKLSMKSYLFKLVPHKFDVDIFISSQEKEKEVQIFYKSINSCIMIPDFFVTITNEVFPGQAISFLQAKIVVKGGKSMFSDYFTKRFGIELAKSIKNLQSFLSEEKFIQDRPKLVVSSTISTQIERSLKKKKPKVEIEQIEVEEVGIDDDTKGELNANISMMRNRKTHLVKIQENMAEKNPFGTPVKRHSGHRNTKDIEYLEPYEYPNFGKYKGSPSKESYIYEDEEEKSNLIEPEIYSNGEHNEIIEEEKICTDTHLQSRHIEEEKNGEIKQEIQEENKGNDQSWRKLCYQDGIWHKWIVERLDDDQKEAYYSVKDKLEQEGISLSENKIIRFLAAREFDEDAAYKMLQENVQFYKKHNISRTFDEDEFRVHIDRESIVPHKADKYGRPVLYMRLRLSKPKEDTDDRKLMLYMLWTMKEVSRRMPKHCDNYILVYDLKDAGLGNINLSQMSGAAKETGSQFPERMYKIIVLNSAWWVDWSWGAIKKIMYPKTVEKVKFFKKKELPEALEEYIPIENIPEEFGGLDKEYATKFRQ